jgi:ketosteroid isomerase-like protein
MSQENVELVRRVYEAFNRGDLDAAVADIAPDAEYVSTGTIPGFAGTYQGPEELRRFLSWLWEEFDEPHIEVHEIIEAGDQVLVSLTNRGRGKQSGADVSWRVWQIGTVRDGKVVRAQGFTSRDEAGEAAGLSAQDAHADS